MRRLRSIASRHAEKFSRVAAVSPMDYYNTIISCKDLHISTDDYGVSKQLNLSPRKGHHVEITYFNQSNEVSDFCIRVG